MLRQKKSGLVGLVLLWATMPALAGVDVGDKPVLVGKTLDGENVSLENLRGKMVLIDFWATWCGPCVTSMPHMKEMYAKYKDKGMVVLGVSLDRNAQAPAEFIKTNDIPWPTMMSPRGLSQEWGVSGIPCLFVIGPEGDVLWRGHPMASDQAIESAFEKHPPQLVDPSVLKTAREEMNRTKQALEAGELTKAFRSFSTIPQDARKDSQFATDIADVDSAIGRAADGLFAEVDELVTAQKYSDASGRLRDLIRGSAGTPIAARAKEKLDTLGKNPQARAAVEKADRESKAGTALDVAKKLQSDQKHELAYPRFRDVTTAFAGTPQATEAADFIGKYESDPVFMSAYNDKVVGGKAQSMLSLARTYAGAGSIDKARTKFKNVIDAFPNTKWAEQAKAELAKLK